MKKIRPFLKWAGNKYHCIETVLSALPAAKRLIEPFTGSGAIFLNSNYSNYLLAESNPDLINLFTYLQREGTLFIDYCKPFFSADNNNATQYYFFREQFNSTQDLRYKAALFLFLNKHGYNGLCRYNKDQRFNVPLGRYQKPYFPEKEMSFFHQKSQHAEFIINDFRQTFLMAEPQDLIYCDPPYVPLSASANFSAYTNKRFNENDQIELAKLAINSAKRGINVVISNHDTPFTRHCYKESTMISFPVNRFISCKINTRQPVQELIAVFKGAS